MISIRPCSSGKISLVSVSLRMDEATFSFSHHCFPQEAWFDSDMSTRRKGMSWEISFAAFLPFLYRTEVTVTSKLRYFTSEWSSHVVSISERQEALHSKKSQQLTITRPLPLLRDYGHGYQEIEFSPKSTVLADTRKIHYFSIVKKTNFLLCINWRFFPISCFVSQYLQDMLHGHDKMWATVKPWLVRFRR